MLVLGLVLAAPIPAAAEAWREQSEATLDGRAVTSIEIRNARGVIDVRPSADGAIHVRALKTARSRTAAEARQLADRTLVKIDRGPALRIEVVYPRLVHHVNLWRHSGDDDSPKSEVRFAIEIPARLAATLVVSSGDIRTEGLAAAQTLRSASGEIRVLDADGPVNARSASGDVDIESRLAAASPRADDPVGCARPLGPRARAATSLGVGCARLRARPIRPIEWGVRCGITAETASGSIEVREAAGWWISRRRAVACDRAGARHARADVTAAGGDTVARPRGRLDGACAHRKGFHRDRRIGGRGAARGAT